jgi:hypothetical protein
MMVNLLTLPPDGEQFHPINICCGALCFEHHLCLHRDIKIIPRIVILRDACGRLRVTFDCHGKSPLGVIPQALQLAFLGSRRQFLYLGSRHHFASVRYT